MRRSPLLTALATSAMFAIMALPASADPRSDGPPGLADKVRKVQEQPVVLTGTIETAIDADGEIVYTIRSGTDTHVLDAGPGWYWGDHHPLSAYVGTSVTISGDSHDDAAEIDVRMVDGTAFREEGKPPWAGGWKRVGELHPAWTQAKADRHQTKVEGCFPPGRCKDKSARHEAPAARGHHPGRHAGLLAWLAVLLEGRDADDR